MVIRGPFNRWILSLILQAQNLRGYSYGVYTPEGLELSEESLDDLWPDYLCKVKGKKDCVDFFQIVHSVMIKKGIPYDLRDDAFQFIVSSFFTAKSGVTFIKQWDPKLALDSRNNFKPLSIEKFFIKVIYDRLHNFLLRENKKSKEILLPFMELDREKEETDSFLMKTLEDISLEYSEDIENSISDKLELEKCRRYISSVDADDSFPEVDFYGKVFDLMMGEHSKKQMLDILSREYPEVAGFSSRKKVLSLKSLLENREPQEKLDILNQIVFDEEQLKNYLTLQERKDNKLMNRVCEDPIFLLEYLVNKVNSREEKGFPASVLNRALKNVRSLIDHYVWTVSRIYNTSI